MPHPRVGLFLRFTSKVGNSMEVLWVLRLNNEILRNKKILLLNQGILLLKDFRTIEIFRPVKFWANLDY